ncbi:YheT family hydrolase [Thalassoglobus sp.]|uniref:YheT family hydrolase n=1 Tax=Thalassoglobus sp. TaxID=2795869 RepID=UPI003AA84AA0
MQTILGACISGITSPREISVRRHVHLDDGDCLLLIDDLPVSDWQNGNDVAILVHGLGGSSESPYVRRIAAKLRSEGMRTFRLNLRGCGEGKGLARNLYHAGRTEDLQGAIEEIQRLCPGSTIHLGGFSLGGNIVLKWLGERPEEAAQLVHRAIAVNPPVRLADCTDAIGKKIFGFYDRYFAKMLYRQLQQSFDGKLDQSQFPPPRRIIEFDETITAPRTGFDSAQHYYETCSAAPVIYDILVPTMILSAADDPLIPARILQELDLPDSIHLHVAESGGHLGYYSRGAVDPDRWWMDWRVLDWFKSKETSSEPCALEAEVV